MPMFTPWEGSPEHSQARKTADDLSKRLTTVKADSQRIVPKLAQHDAALRMELV